MEREAVIEALKAYYITASVEWEKHKKIGCMGLRIKIERPKVDLFLMEDWSVLSHDSHNTVTAIVQAISRHYRPKTEDSLK